MIRREKEIPATHLHRRSFDISLAIPWRYREPAWKWQLAVFFVVDCVSELGQHHVDAQQAGERGNNLVSDIPLNAYISYNVSMLKTWSRHSSRTGAGGGIIILVQPELSEDEVETISCIISPAILGILTFTCVAQEFLSSGFFVMLKR